MDKNCQLKKETFSLLLIKIALVEEEQLGEFYQVLKTKKKERYFKLINI